MKTKYPTWLDMAVEQWRKDRQRREEFEQRFDDFVDETRREFGHHEENEFGPVCP